MTNWWEKLNVSQKKDSTWHYYNVDEILILSEQFNGGKLDGITKTFYEEGEVYEIKNWINGVENGKWEQFYTNGHLIMSTTYKKGILSGKYIYYYPNGKVDFEGNYKNNLKVGEWFYFSEVGVQDTIIKYNE